MARSRKKYRSHPKYRALRVSPPSSERSRLKRAADEAFSTKQDAFGDWRAARQDRNSLRRQLNHCEEKLSAVELKLTRERTERSARMVEIDDLIKVKEAEIQQCKREGYDRFKQANAMKKEGDRDACFLRWEGYDFNERCLALETEIQALQVEREMMVGTSGILPSQAEYDSLRHQRKELADQLALALMACTELEADFREKEKKYYEAQEKYNAV